MNTAVSMLKLFVLFIFSMSLLVFADCVYAHSPELVVQNGHSAGVHGVALSPNGQIVVSGGVDKSLILWDATTGKQLRSLTGHTDRIGIVVFSPDGKLLASAGDDRTIMIWDTDTQKSIATLRGHNDSVRSLSFNQQGTLLASASDSSCCLWDVKSCQKVRDLIDVKCPVSFNLSGKMFAGRIAGKKIRILETSKWSTVRTLVGHSNEPYSISWSDDDQELHSCARNEILSWHLHQDSRSETQPSSALETRTSFETDSTLVVGEQAIAWGDANVVKVLNLKTMTISEFVGHSQPVTCLAVSKDCKNLISGSTDYSSKLWDIKTGRALQTYSGQSSALYSLAISSDGKLLASGGWDRNVKLWNATTGQKLPDLTGHNAWIYSIAISPNSKMLASGDISGGIKLWDLEKMKIKRELSGHTEWVGSVSFSPDNKSLVSSSKDGFVKIWDTESGQLVKSLKHGHRLITSSVDWTAKTIASGTDTDIERCNLDSGDCLSPIKTDSKGGENEIVAYNNTGTLLASAGEGNSVSIWDVQTGQKLRELKGHLAPVYSLEFSPDGLKLVSAGQDCIVRLWDVASGNSLQTLTGHHFCVSSVKFSRDGKLLISSSWDTTIKIWDVGGGRLIASLCSMDNKDWSVVSPDGRFDATDGGMRRMHYNIANEVVELKQCKDRFFEPGLLAKLLNFNKEPLRDISGFDNVELYPDISCDVSDDDKTLRVKLKNRGGGIGKLIVKVNGKELDVSEQIAKTPVSKNAPTAEVRINLSGVTSIVPGVPNIVSVSAFNADEYLSSRDVIPIRQWVPRGDSKVEPPEIYAIIGGVSTYSAPGKQLDLTYAAKDACDFAKALELASKRLFGAEKVHLNLLTTAPDGKSRTPTKQEFVKAFESARKARPNDILVVYLSGHGTTTRQGTDTYCYLTSDAYTTELNDPEIRKKTTITSDELLEWTSAKAIPALKQVLILDTCAAGAVANKLSEKKNVSGDQIRAIERLKDRSGFHVLMGCTADAVSYEASRYGQGLLTHSLLEGMRGPALVEERTEKLVDVQKLFQYAADSVPELAKGIGGIQKPQVSIPTGTSFWIGRLTKEDMGQIPVAGEKAIILRPLLMGKRRDDMNLTAALKTKLYDDLSLVVGNRSGINAVYVAADEMSGAFSPTGSYRLDGDVIVVDMAVTKDDIEVANFQVSGDKNSIDSLVAEMCNKIYRCIGAL